ncbi:hypothetical protein ACQP00_35335 [Dactylosporangium sp. CS-047395]|uniref:hypothetical protein n=1 Tax=Dactylosporangium sp. CS-047395 TaxID=3239936 RepID=UPI003D92A98F
MAIGEASTIVRWYAYAGCLALVPFVVAGFRLPWYGTAVVLGAALAAWALLLTLIRPTAVAVPLPAVWAAAGLITVYGTSALLLHGTVSAGALAAGGYGWALLVTAASHQRRYSAAVRSAASASSARSSTGATTSASGPRASSWV